MSSGNIVNVSGYEAYKSAVSQFPTKHVYSLFVGTHENGKSWCPDCVKCRFLFESLTMPFSVHFSYCPLFFVWVFVFFSSSPAEPFILKHFQSLKNSVLIFCHVGDRSA
eukprot:Sdes_comp20400_c0_seq1m14375